MLAGRMKLKTFIALVGLGSPIVLVGALWGVGAFEERAPVEDRAAIALEHYDKVTQERQAREAAEREAARQAADAQVEDLNTLMSEAQQAAVQAEVDANTTATPAPATDPSRPWDGFLMGKAGSSLGTKKIKDAKKGGAWKVNLYQDDGEAVMNRAKVDIDRDDKWDEKWTFASDGITRKVAPKDDEDYTERYRWDGSAWVAD